MTTFLIGSLRSMSPSSFRDDMWLVQIGPSDKKRFLVSQYPGLQAWDQVKHTVWLVYQVGPKSDWLPEVGTKHVVRLGTEYDWLLEVGSKPVVITRFGPIAINAECRRNYRPFPYIIIGPSPFDYYVCKRVIISSAFLSMDPTKPWSDYKDWVHYYKCRRN